MSNSSSNPVHLKILKIDIKMLNQAIWNFIFHILQFKLINVSLKKQESSRETFISDLLTMPKPFTLWITVNCGKFWKKWEYQTTWPASWEICMQVRKQQLELDMDQQTGSK